MVVVVPPVPAPPLLVVVPPPLVPVPPPVDDPFGTVVVVVGGVVVTVTEPVPDVPVPVPATVLAGALVDGAPVETTARTALDDPALPVAPPAVWATGVEKLLATVPLVGAGAAGAAGGGDDAGAGVKFGTSSGPGPDDCAEINGWMIGPGPTTSPATTEPAAAQAATDAMNGFRGKNPGRTRRTTAAAAGIAAAAALGSGRPKLRDLKTSSRLASSSGLAASGVNPSIFLHQKLSNWRGRCVSERGWSGTQCSYPLYGNHIAVM